MASPGAISLVINADDVQNMLAKIPDGPARDTALKHVLDKGGLVVQRGIMDAMPSLTGSSRRNTTVELNGLTAKVTIRGGAAFAEVGTQPHPITPTKGGKLLKFVMQGGANPNARLTGRARKGSQDFNVFALAVNHPGQAAQHFIQVGVTNSLEDFRHVMIEGLAGMIGAK